MLYEFLKNNYKEAEPIFFSDIVIKGITKSAVNQQLKKLCNEGKLQKYENGIYYLPKKSRLKTSVGSKCRYGCQIQICFQRWESRWLLFGKYICQSVGNFNAGSQ